MLSIISLAGHLSLHFSIENAFDLEGLEEICTFHPNAEIASGSRTFLPLYPKNATDCGGKHSTILAARYIPWAVARIYGPFLCFLVYLPLLHLLFSQHPLVLRMPRAKTSLLCSLLLAAHSTTAQQQFTPRGDIGKRHGSSLQKRITCEPARPDVSEDAVRIRMCAVYISAAH